MFIAQGVVFQKSVFLRKVSGSMYLEGVQETPGLDPPSTEKINKVCKELRSELQHRVGRLSQREMPEMFEYQISLLDND